ncbi:MAG: ion transporter [Pseudomonadota bacterium]
MPKPAGLRGRVLALVESRPFQRTIIALIVLNAILLGLETSPRAVAAFGALLGGLDRAMLAVFVVELLLRLYAHRSAFFRDPWSVFDLLVVGVALVPASGPLAVLRALRVLRVLRLVSASKSMRGVVGALLGALPGMGSIALLLVLVLYVAAVMATKLFGAIAPDYFGSLGGSLFTLFQIMTMEGWADIAREVLVEAPLAWIFFLAVILVSTFTVLNLFIAVVVNAMQEQVAEDLRAEEGAHAAEAQAERRLLLEELRALRRDVGELRERLDRAR